MSNPTVLVIDDEVEIAEFVADVIEMMDLTVTFVSDSVELDAVPLDDVRLIVMDLIMPGTSGISLLDRFANLTGAPEIIFMSGETASVLEAAGQRASELGLSVVGTLAKPFFAADLEFMVLESQLLRARL